VVVLLETTPKQTGASKQLSAGIQPKPGRGGRPSKAAAAQLRDRILDVATARFLANGYGATSIEAIAKATRMSKRTFYHRFRDKAALFEAVVRRLVDEWLPTFEAPLRDAAPIDAVLRRSAGEMLAVAMSPKAMALSRLMRAEAHQFPQLAHTVHEYGFLRGVERIADLLTRAAEAGHIARIDTSFAAEQFFHMILAGPPSLANGLGRPPTEDEINRWVDQTVDLFLNGCLKPR